MKLVNTLLGIAVAFTPVAAFAQHVDLDALKAEHDRCMRNVALHDSREELNDELLFDKAVKECQEFKDPLYAGVRARYSPEQGAEIIEIMEEREKPAFIYQLTLIRYAQQQAS